MTCTNAVATSEEPRPDVVGPRSSATIDSRNPQVKAFSSLAQRLKTVL